MIDDRNSAAESVNLDPHMVEMRALAACLIDARLDQALAASPEFSPRPDFTARVMEALSEPSPAIRVTPRYGPLVLLGCGVLLALVLLLWLPGLHSKPQWLVSLLSLELAAIALGAGPWRHVLRWPA